MTVLVSSIPLFVLLAVVLTLQGCGGDAPSTTPGPPSPTPAPTVTSCSYANTTVELGTGISLSGDASATLIYDLTTQVVSGSALDKLFAEHMGAFTPAVAKLIEAALGPADTIVAGPAMLLMMTNLQAPLSNASRDFLMALDSSDSLTISVELKGNFTVKSDSSIPRTYFPCIEALRINFMSGDTMIKSLIGLMTDSISTCSSLGIHQDKDRTSSPMLV